MEATPEDWIRTAVARLQSHGYVEVQPPWANWRVLSLRSGDRGDVMSVRRLPTFVVFMATHDASVEQLHNLVRDATSWLASIKGPTRPGVHNGAAVLPVLVARSCPPETRLEAERRQPRQEPVFPLPVLVELEARRAHTFAGARLWGLCRTSVSWGSSSSSSSTDSPGRP